jgi:hypothetical protein
MGFYRFLRPQYSFISTQNHSNEIKDSVNAPRALNDLKLAIKLERIFEDSATTLQPMESCEEQSRVELLSTQGFQLLLAQKQFDEKSTKATRKIPEQYMRS